MSNSDALAALLVALLYGVIAREMFEVMYDLTHHKLIALLLALFFPITVPFALSVNVIKKHKEGDFYDVK